MGMSLSFIMKKTDLYKLDLLKDAWTLNGSQFTFRIFDLLKSGRLNFRRLIQIGLPALAFCLQHFNSCDDLGQVLTRHSHCVSGIR